MPNPTAGTSSGGSDSPAGGSSANTAGTKNLMLGGTGGSSSGGNAGSAGSAVDNSGCGDGVLQPVLGEKCDDGNSDAGDGCSADCKAVEQNFKCLTPGKACESTVACGDGKVAGTETCDDGNADAKDGCDATC
ncbi:MAG TPA: DUF4215 domain-containing protein, partial [Polyangiaceae bacterium]|nr:DUF4215 domain-containing protein [Polyangiaceae bacterium]